MSALLKFRFRWRVDGADHNAVIQAPDYPLACYRLALLHADGFLKRGEVPPDFKIDLTIPERVDE